MNAAQMRDRVRAIKAHFHLPSLVDGARETGRDAFRSACPLHGGAGATAFAMAKRNGSWAYHCFACGESGDAIDIVMKLDGLSMLEALDKLDGGITGPLPPRRQVGTSIVVVCDACRTSTVTLRDRTYRKIGGGEYVIPAIAMHATGWEIAPDLVGAVCPDCLERAERRGGIPYKPVGTSPASHTTTIDVPTCRRGGKGPDAADRRGEPDRDRWSPV